MHYNTLVRVVTVERQGVIAVQYGAIFGHDDPFPVCTRNHTKQIWYEFLKHVSEPRCHFSAGERLQVQRMNSNRINHKRYLTCNTKLPEQLQQRRAGRSCKRSTWWQSWHPCRGLSREGGEGEAQVWGRRRLCSPDRSRDLNHPPGPRYRRMSCCSWGCSQTPGHLMWRNGTVN